ncbi:unnamed protein product [Leptosia nina]|uniref:CCHC-type domain-containing protein n=1 Tax=Leptosia nina TaxID=320188 RepID=A0AAV1JU92_9NEOP
MNPASPNQDGDGITAQSSLAPTSEAGCSQNAPRAANKCESDEKLLLLLEQQNRNFLAMLEAVKQSRTPNDLHLPDFDPDRRDVDARAWIITADTCITDGYQHGAPLMIALSRAMKGDASTWLSTVSFPGMTWENFKELFTARYACPETVASYLINMAGSRPKENECLATYGAAMMTSIMSRWKGLTTEQIAVATVLAHISQFEPRIQRLSFTTDIDNRKRLQQELTAVSFLKRKAPLSSDATDFKKIRPATNHTSIKCFHCGKLGHKSTQCFSKRNLKTNGDKDRSQTYFNNRKKSAAEQLPITCYSCHGQGHYASSCPKQRSKDLDLDLAT